MRRSEDHTGETKITGHAPNTRVIHFEDNIQLKNTTNHVMLFLLGFHNMYWFCQKHPRNANNSHYDEYLLYKDLKQKCFHYYRAVVIKFRRNIKFSNKISVVILKKRLWNFRFTKNSWSYAKEYSYLSREHVQRFAVFQRFNVIFEQNHIDECNQNRRRTTWTFWKNYKRQRTTLVKLYAFKKAHRVEIN